MFAPGANPLIRKIPRNTVFDSGRKAEIEAWQRRRHERAQEIEERRRVERRAAARKRFPKGYGENGRVPSYVQEHISALEASPLGAPVFSALRQRDASTPLTAGMRGGRRSTGAPPIATPMRHFRTAEATESSFVEKRAHAKNRLMTAGLCLPRPQQPHQQEERRAASSLGVSLSSPSHRTQIADSGGSIQRPATAPSGRTKRTTRRTRSVSASPSRSRSSRPKSLPPRMFSMANVEAQLLEKLNGLSSFQPPSEYPTVCALKTAVAVKAIQAKLRECRGVKSRRGVRKDRTGSANVGLKAHPSSAAAVERSAGFGKASTGAPRLASAGCDRRRKSRRGEMRQAGVQVAPWNNHSPFIPVENSSTTRRLHSSTSGVGRPKSAPALRALTSNDPVFGNNAWETGFHHRRLSRSFSPGKGAQTRPSTSPIPITADGDTAGYTSSFSSDDENREIATQNLHNAFRRLTVGALIELNRLHTPPKPVSAVLAALGCLLGLRSLSSTGSHKRCALLFSNAYVLRDLLDSVRPHRISPRRLSVLTRKLDAADATPSKVKGASAAASALLEWLQAVVACARGGAGILITATQLARVGCDRVEHSLEKHFSQPGSRVATDWKHSRRQAPTYSGV